MGQRASWQQPREFEERIALFRRLSPTKKLGCSTDTFSGEKNDSHWQFDSNDRGSGLKPIVTHWPDCLVILTVYSQACACLPTAPVLFEVANLITVIADQRSVLCSGSWVSRDTQPLCHSQWIHHRMLRSTGHGSRAPIPRLRSQLVSLSSFTKLSTSRHISLSLSAILCPRQALTSFSLYVLFFAFYYLHTEKTLHQRDSDELPPSPTLFSFLCGTPSHVCRAWSLQSNVNGNESSSPQLVWCFFPSHVFTWRSSIFWVCIGSFFIEDFYFYWIHRLLHYGPFYKHIHKIHHDHSGDIATGLSASYLQLLSVWLRSTPTLSKLSFWD